MKPWMGWLALYILLCVYNPISGATVPYFFRSRPATFETVKKLSFGYALMGIIAASCFIAVPIVALVMLVLPFLQCVVWWRFKLARASIPVVPKLFRPPSIFDKAKH